MHPKPGITSKKVCLVVIDGWGISNPSSPDLDAIASAQTPTMDHLISSCHYTEIVAHGSDVGLPPDLMGNSEVGHLNIGAGRIVYQDITRIDKAFRDGCLEQKIIPILKDQRILHLIGLVSDGGVHSSLSHLVSLLNLCKRHNTKVVLHAITDGRDTAPASALKYLQHVQEHIGILYFIFGQ